MLNPTNNIFERQREELTLLQLNNRIKGAVSHAFPDTCWIRAEMADVRVNSSSGHCYLEFVEKDASGRQMLAKAKGAIWARVFTRLKPYFEKETGQSFTSGIKVLVRVSVEFHELYGFSLSVQDIDPSYTVGDMARKRKEIIEQLRKEGIYGLNRELTLAPLPRRIAIITSPTAAGYEDFVNQLYNNRGGYPFYTKLFPAIMQGDMTERSVIAALDRIYQYAGLFDAVAIIRGGGSTSDLNSFDTYELAANCAQFPLPIISGIGHERDDTAVDLVAHTRMKTPTAVAEFLIGRMDIAAETLAGLQQRTAQLTVETLQRQKQFLQQLGAQLPRLAANRIERSRIHLHGITAKLPLSAGGMVNRQEKQLGRLQDRLKNYSLAFLKEREKQLEFTGQFIRMASPEYILKRGYSLSLLNGKIIKKAALLKVGDELVTRFTDGTVISKVEKTELQ